MEILIWLVVLIVVATVLAILAVPLILNSRERLRVDLERRLAEVQLQRITSEAMLRLLREGRKP